MFFVLVLFRRVNGVGHMIFLEGILTLTLRLNCFATCLAISRLVPNNLIRKIDEIWRVVLVVSREVS